MEDSVLLKRREVQLERRLVELRRDRRIFFYVPHAKQELFHNAADFHYRYVRTGNRWGKSTCGGTEDTAFALGYRPWLSETDPRRTLGIPRHPTKGLIVTTDWDKSTEVFTSTEEGPSQGTLFRYIPKDCLIDFTKNHSGAIDCIRVRHVSGGTSTIHLDTVKSFKQNPLGQESSAWDWVHFDEPVPEPMFNAIIRGMIDRDGRCWFTCTPLEEPWIDAKFIPNLELQSLETVDAHHGDFWMMTGKTDDNPHLDAAAIERVMQNYSEDERETRRSGIPKAYSGLVYKEFEWGVHVRRNPPYGWKDWTSPPADHAIRFAIDYHPRKPHHVLFISTSPNEYHYVFAEIFESCLMSDLVIDCRFVLGLREPSLPGLIDPLSDTPNRVTESTPMEEVLRLGLPVMPATKDPHNGILKVKELLRRRDRAGNPTFIVNSECKRFLFEISRGYVWDGETNKPKKQNDDAMENLYRLALQGLFYIEPTTAADYRAPSRTDIDQVDLDDDLFTEDLVPNMGSNRFRERYRI
jgi:hypothetical protein